MPVILYYSCNLFIELILSNRANEGSSILNSKHKLNVYLGIGISHL